jgi:hypothetical protein
MRQSKLAFLHDASYLKGEFSRKMIYGKTRCSRRTTKKYASRPSPSYPANDCCGMKKTGNDGSKYMSVLRSNGSCYWKKIARKNV